MGLFGIRVGLFWGYLIGLFYSNETTSWVNQTEKAQSLNKHLYTKRIILQLQGKVFLTEGQKRLYIRTGVSITDYSVILRGIFNYKIQENLSCDSNHNLHWCARVMVNIGRKVKYK